MKIAEPPQVSWSLISICEEGNFPTIKENEYLISRLNLQFHDIDRVDPEKTNEIIFNEMMAKQIVDWVLLQRENDVAIIYVHCLMGQSRSAGVAAALDKALNGDDMKYFSNGLHKPNMLVYRNVLEECFNQGLIC